MAFPPRSPSLNVNSRSAVNGYISSFGLPSAPVFAGVNPGAEPATTIPGTERTLRVVESRTRSVHAAFGNLVYTIGDNTTQVDLSGLDINDVTLKSDITSITVATERVGTSVNLPVPSTDPLIPTPPAAALRFTGQIPPTASRVTDSALESDNFYKDTTYTVLDSQTVVINKSETFRIDGQNRTVSVRANLKFMLLYFYPTSSSLANTMNTVVSISGIGGSYYNTFPAGFRNVIGIYGGFTAEMSALSRMANPAHATWIAARNAYNTQVSTFNADRLRYQAFIAPANLNPGIPTITVGSRTDNSATIGITKGQYADSTDLDGDAPIPDENTTGTSRTYTGLSPSTTYRVRARARRSLNTQAVPPAQTPIS